MDLNELLQDFPGVRLATPADNQGILRFFNETELRGGRLELQIDRSPDFFSLLGLQAEETFVFLFEDGNKNVQGIATILVRPGFIQGQLTKVGYLGDLRTRFHRGPIRAWRGIFQKILSGEVREFSGVRHWITAVINANSRAHLALVQSKRGGHRYDLLTPYWMVNVFARPLLRRTTKGPRIRRAQQGDLENVSRFLEEENRSQAFGFSFSSELPRRLMNWPGLEMRNFLLAEDEKGNLLGCLAPWESSSVKRIRVSRLPATLRVLAPLLPAPVAMGKNLRILYLTHLTVRGSLAARDRLGVFRAMFDEAWNESRNQGIHMVSFCSFASQPWQKALEPAFHQAIPMTLFSVSHAEAPQPNWSCAELLQPGFEMALV